MLATPVRFECPTILLSGAKGQWFKSTRVYCRKFNSDMNFDCEWILSQAHELFDNVVKNCQF